MLNFSNLSSIQSGETLFSKASFQINPGEKVGLVGPNGCGKSTLFRMIIGEQAPTTGQVSFPDKMRLSYFSQNVGEMTGKTALQEVVEGDENVRVLQEKLKEYEELLVDCANMSEDEMNSVLGKMGDVQTEFEKVGGYDLETRAQEILTGLGIAPVDHAKDSGDFSGGWKMRIALAKVLVTNPDVIVMDEPTNYLDMETILWLEEWLKNFKGSVFMTTHDRDFMNNICKKIVSIEHRKIVVYSGDYNFYMKERKLRLSQLKSEAAKQKESLAKDEEFIAKFKARASHAAQVQSRVKKLEKIDRIEIPPEEEKMSFDFPNPSRGSDEVAIIKELSKSWKNSTGELNNIFSNLTSTVTRMSKIAVVGVNGAGKSTLLKCICKETDPTDGIVQLGPSVKLGYFSQFSLDVLNPENSVFDEVREGLSSASDGYVRNLLAAFLFRGDDVKKKVKYLSGGEKSRLVLAVLLSQNNNFLVLDEPTNHLDISSREVLLAALSNFEGTIMFVSHDRHFLHALTETVMEVDKGGVINYPGNYKYYLDKKGLS
jgi:ATP-binding cassette subfamily F protein 3